jgi:predicted phosphodiesterase
VIRGNHERYVLDLASDPTDRPGLDGDVRQSVRWTLAQIDTNGNVDAIAALPEQLVLEGPAGSMIRVVHATMRHDRDNLIASTSDAELREMVDLQAQLFCCGHTHRPLIRQIDQTLVVNAGSVGLPFDNDPRAGYAQIQWLEGGWRAEMIRLHYDRVRALRDMTTSGMLATCGATAQVIQAEIEDAHPYIARWVTTYDQAVIDGVMSAVESVPVFFREHRAAVRATEEPPVLYPHHAS